MATASMVKVADGGDDTPAKWDVEVVNVFARNGLRAEVDTHGGENDLLEVALEIGVVRTDRVEGRAVELVEARCEKLERSWALALARPAIAEGGGDSPFPNPAMRWTAG